MRELAQDAGAPEGTPQIGVNENEAVIVGRFGARSRVQPGEQLIAVVDTRALHFFDPGTGNGIYDSPKGDQS
jgi:multiple sugar transport system ATP-binding protein